MHSSSNGTSNKWKRKAKSPEINSKMYFFFRLFSLRVVVKLNKVNRALTFDWYWPSNQMEINAKVKLLQQLSMVKKKYRKLIRPDVNRNCQTWVCGVRVLVCEVWICNADNKSNEKVQKINHQIATPYFLDISVCYKFVCVFMCVQLQ